MHDNPNDPRNWHTFDKMMNTNAEGLDRGDLVLLVGALRVVVDESKAQWDKVAAILQAEGDDVDDVFAKARTVMAGLDSGTESASELVSAREAFPSFRAAYAALDSALLYEFERLRKADALRADMSVEQFLQFKRDAVMYVTGVNEKTTGDRRWSRAKPAPNPKSRWTRAIDAICEWTGYGKSGM